MTDNLLLSGTFLACARGAVLLDDQGRFTMPAATPAGAEIAASVAGEESGTNGFILFSRN